MNELVWMIVNDGIDGHERNERMKIEKSLP